MGTNMRNNYYGTSLLPFHSHIACCWLWIGNSTTSQTNLSLTWYPKIYKKLLAMHHLTSRKCNMPIIKTIDMMQAMPCCHAIYIWFPKATPLIHQMAFARSLSHLKVWVPQNLLEDSVYFTACVGLKFMLPFYRVTTFCFIS